MFILHTGIKWLFAAIVDIFLLQPLRKNERNILKFHKMRERNTQPKKRATEKSELTYTQQPNCTRHFFHENIIALLATRYVFFHPSYKPVHSRGYSNYLSARDYFWQWRQWIDAAQNFAGGTQSSRAFKSRFIRCLSRWGCFFSTYSSTDGFRQALDLQTRARSRMCILFFHGVRMFFFLFPKLLRVPHGVALRRYIEVIVFIFVISARFDFIEFAKAENCRKTSRVN